MNYGSEEEKMTRENKDGKHSFREYVVGGVRFGLWFGQELAKAVPGLAGEVFDELVPRRGRVRWEDATRRRYKYAVLEPYIGQLPQHVVETMLDIDTYPLHDQHGDVGTSLYQLRLKNGDVERTIKMSESYIQGKGKDVRH